MVEPLEEIAYVARSPNRVAILEALERGPHTRHELGEITGASRATLARVLGELEDRRWIERSGDHYLPTELGLLVQEAFSTLVDTMCAAGTLRDVAHLLPTDPDDELDVDIDLRAYAGASITRPDPDDPTAHMDQAFEFFATADSLQVLSNTAIPRMVAGAAERLAHEAFSFGATIPASFAHDLAADSDVLAGFHDIVDAGGSLRLYDDRIEHNVVIADENVVLWLCDGEGGNQGLLVTDNDRVREWAASQVDRYAAEATPFEDVTLSRTSG